MAEASKPTDARSAAEERLQMLEQALQKVGELCLMLAGSGGSGPVAATPAPPSQSAALGEVVPLRPFLQSISGQDLSSTERIQVAEVAQAMLEQVYVHLPLKRAMHAIDPIQRLKILRRRLDELSVRAFHGEMISIFHSLRDLHTNYVLPAAYQGWTAFLPFLIEAYYEGSDETQRQYVVTRLLTGFSHPDFAVGVNLTHWNSVPIARAVELNAEREAGSNDDARLARGLEALTIRPMGLTAPPDEEWVVVGYEAGGQQRDLRFDWMVFSPSPSPSGPVLSATASGAAVHLGVDTQTEAVRRAKKALFFPAKMATERQMAAQSVPHAALPDGLHSGPANLSRMPDVFEFKRVPGPGGELGYIRIYTFMVDDADAFLFEFIRIARRLPQTGLIIDVRGNGGGNILAGERLLQVLTPRKIDPERFHFINTLATRELCQKSPLDLDLTRWSPSISLSVETGEIYSQGFTLEPVEHSNQVGQQYPGPVILIVDALCYSTTDIFSAGFQDHQIGKILGTSHHTGAGGANVWEYGLLQTALPDYFPTLPKGTTFRVAIRRTTRVGERSGVPVEDLGVEPNEVHRTTRADVLQGNVDLIAHAASMLAVP
jgi:hypothetical protein